MSRILNGLSRLHNDSCESYARGMPNNWAKGIPMGKEPSKINKNWKATINTTTEIKIYVKENKNQMNTQEDWNVLLRGQIGKGF